MKKLLLLTSLLIAIPIAAYAGSVANLERSGTSIYDTPIWKVTCTDGSTTKYFWAYGEWYKPFTGAIGHRSKSRKEMAEYFCR